MLQLHTQGQGCSSYIHRGGRDIPITFTEGQGYSNYFHRGAGVFQLLSQRSRGVPLTFTGEQGYPSLVTKHKQSYIGSYFYMIYWK